MSSEPDAQAQAVYTAIKGVLGPDYELRQADLQRAAHAAVTAFAAACNPPLLAVHADEEGRLILAAGNGTMAAEDYGKAMRAWVFRQILAEREWLHFRLQELPDEWTLCLHRRSRIDNEWPADASDVSLHFEVAVHQLPPRFVCDSVPREQYQKPPFRVRVEPS